MSASSQPNLDTRGVIVPIAEGEPVLRHAEREISILLARKQITITHARRAKRSSIAIVTGGVVAGLGAHLPSRDLRHSA